MNIEAGSIMVRDRVLLGTINGNHYLEVKAVLVDPEDEGIVLIGVEQEITFLARADQRVAVQIFGTEIT